MEAEVIADHDLATCFYFKSAKKLCESTFLTKVLIMLGLLCEIAPFQLRIACHLEFMPIAYMYSPI